MSKIIWVIVIIIVALAVWYGYATYTDPADVPVSAEDSELVEPGSLEDVSAIEDELEGIDLEGLDAELGDIDSELEGL